MLNFLAYTTLLPQSEFVKSGESLLRVLVGVIHHLKHIAQLFLLVEQNLPTHVLPNECHTRSAQSKG